MDGVYAQGEQKMSEYRRFFAQPNEKISDKTIALTAEYNHIAKVLRCKTGEKVIVCFNDGLDNLCQINSVTTDTVYMDILDSFVNENEKHTRISLFFGVLKGDNTDLVVQKAVELGAAQIVPFTSTFTVSDCKESKAARLTKIAHEASKQCGRATLMDIPQAITYNELKNRLSEYDLSLFCYEKGGISIQKAIETHPDSIAVVIGAEGGFSDKEAEELSEIATTIHFGSRILRAETASIYALSVLDALLG